MKEKKTLKFLTIGIVCMCAIWKIFHTPSKVDPLSVEALYGRWQIKDARGYYWHDKPEVTKETFEHIGKTVEFHKRYIIVDGEQCSNLRYIYYTCASFGDQISLDDAHVLELPYRLDYWYDEVDKASDYIFIRPSIDGTYQTPKSWFHGRFTLVSDKLYVGGKTGYLYLERIPDRPWWQRAQSYLKAVFAPRYDATKIVPQEMWDHWEIVEPNKVLRKSFKDDPDYECTKWEQERFKRLKGKRFILHPKYVILEGKQYNNPRYSESLDADKTKCYFLDDYNGYKMEGENLAWSGVFCIGKEGAFETRDYICRRLPPPSLWQRVKYYWNYLIDKDDSTRGDFFNQKSREKEK